MARYQFVVDAKKYIEEITPFTAASTLADFSRKLLYIARLFTDLYVSKLVTTNNPRNITAADINSFVNFRRKTVKDSTIRKDISIMRRFLVGIGCSGELDRYKSVYGGCMPKSQSKRNDPLPNDVIDRVYALARETDRWPIMEGCMAIVLGTSCGLRPQESRRMYASHVFPYGDSPEIFVKNVKGTERGVQPRKVLIMDGVSDIFEKYLAMRESKLEEFGVKTDSLFPTLRTGKEFLSQQSFGRLKQLVEAKVGSKFELRSARRAFGQRQIDNEAPLDEVSLAMGHTTTKTTEKYYARRKETPTLRRMQMQEMRTARGGA